MEAGDYAIPHQGLSLLMIGPGTSITQDALRILALHGTALMAVGGGGVRCYTAPPIGPGDSILARRQVRIWANPTTRMEVVHAMYELRLNERLPDRSLSALRGIEGARMKAIYASLADRYQIPWWGRVYDRQNPTAADMPNQAINHAVSCRSSSYACYSFYRYNPTARVHSRRCIDCFCSRCRRPFPPLFHCSRRLYVR